MGYKMFFILLLLTAGFTGRAAAGPGYPHDSVYKDMKRVENKAADFTRLFVPALYCTAMPDYTDA